MSRQFLPAAIVLLCSAFSHALLAQAAQQLWQDNGQFAAASTSLLPGAVSYQRAVEIPLANVQALTTGKQISLELAPSEFVEFALRSSRNYLNGDVGWHGTARIAGRLASLSLVENAHTVLATVNTGEHHYTISTRRQGAEGNYHGYLYTQGVGAARQQIDDGGIPLKNAPQLSEPAEVLALSGNDVTIVQQVSDNIAVVGDQLDVTVTVTNNTGGTLTGEELNVLFIVDETDLLSSSSICSLVDLGAQLSLQCALPSIAPAASTSINYSVRLTDASYPSVSSGVFVGDVFGESVRNDAFAFVARDTLLDTDNDGQSDFNEALAGTDANNAASVVDANATVETDLMFLYTQKFVDDIGGVTPETKINQLIEATNAYYANSQVGIIFRPVLYRFVDYDLNNSLLTAFDRMENAIGEFNFVPDTRSQVGADIVVLIDGTFTADVACGFGTTPGVGYTGELFSDSIIDPNPYITLYTDGFPQGGGSGCDDLTLAHELGHNHGLDHSHREVGAEGTFSFALGHGVDGSFATIMASTSDYPGSEELPLFSNPDSTDCNGLPCGVSRTDLEQGADAVFTLNHTRFQVANRRASRISSITSLGGSSNLIAYGGASRSSDPETPVTDFSASDAIDVRMTLEIPSEHRGATGETYVVIAVDGLGLFYRDATGNYVGWDGSLASLKPNITPRALNTTEELVAFENFVPLSVDVDTAALTVYFAYSVSNTEVFAYTTDGVPLTIQP